MSYASWAGKWAFLSILKDLKKFGSLIGVAIFSDILYERDREITVHAREIHVHSIRGFSINTFISSLVPIHHGWHHSIKNVFTKLRRNVTYMHLLIGQWAYKDEN